MAAPEYVPTSTSTAKHYSSPPQRHRETTPRPGETFGNEPHGAAFGSQGPDQGFVLTLTSVFDTKIALAEGEHRSDVDAGCIPVALKRASLFHRAPVVHDLRIAYTLFGYLDADAPDELVAWRRPVFAEVHHSFHYFERRAIADQVDAAVLTQTPDEVATRYRADWRDQLGLAD